MVRCTLIDKGLTDSQTDRNADSPKLTDITDNRRQVIDSYN
jgi:hypothetical protein